MLLTPEQKAYNKLPYEEQQKLINNSFLNTKQMPSLGQSTSQSIPKTPSISSSPISNNFTNWDTMKMYNNIMNVGQPQQKQQVQPPYAFTQNNNVSAQTLPTSTSSTRATTSLSSPTQQASNVLPASQSQSQSTNNDNQLPYSQLLEKLNSVLDTNKSMESSNAYYQDAYDAQVQKIQAAVNAAKANARAKYQDIIDKTPLMYQQQRNQTDVLGAQAVNKTRNMLASMGLSNSGFGTTALAKDNATTRNLIGQVNINERQAIEDAQKGMAQAESMADISQVEQISQATSDLMNRLGQSRTNMDNQNWQRIIDTMNAYRTINADDYAKQKDERLYNRDISNDAVDERYKIGTFTGYDPKTGLATADTQYKQGTLDNAAKSDYYNYQTKLATDKTNQQKNKMDALKEKYGFYPGDTTANYLDAYDSAMSIPEFAQIIKEAEQSGNMRAYIDQTKQEFGANHPIIAALEGARINYISKDPEMLYQYGGDYGIASPKIADSAIKLMNDRLNNQINAIKLLYADPQAQADLAKVKQALAIGDQDLYQKTVESISLPEKIKNELALQGEQIQNAQNSRALSWANYGLSEANNQLANEKFDYQKGQDEINYKYKSAQELDKQDTDTYDTLDKYISDVYMQNGFDVNGKSTGRKVMTAQDKKDIGDYLDLQATKGIPVNVLKGLRAKYSINSLN